MDINEIMRLVQAVSDYALTSLKIEDGDCKISIKREKECYPAAAAVPAAAVSAAAPAAEIPAAAQVQAVVPVSVAAPVGSPVSIANPVNMAGTASPAVNIESDQVVVSPLVGTFYSSANPESEPFVKVGDTVKKGQVLGIIEAMKLMNEIESEYDGVVEAILVNNEDVVEYGQPLFRIH